MRLWASRLNHLVPDIIRARSFRLAEGDGDNVQAELGVDPEGWATLSMMDSEGIKLIGAAVAGSNAPLSAQLWVNAFVAFTETINPEDNMYETDEETDHVGAQNGGEILIELINGDDLLEWPSPRSGLQWPKYDESGDRLKSIHRKETLMPAEEIEKDSGALYSKLFQLVDDSENVRARLALEDGSPALTMYDRGGTGRLRIGMLHGQSGIYIADKDGNVRIGIQTLDNGETGLYVYDDEGWLAYSISVDADGVVGETGL